MDNSSLKQCPVGIQTFSNIIESGYLYVDKTEYIYRMASASAKYYFLSRPRRFGKSLLTSTMKSYFEGHRELFVGLAMEKLEKDWTVHPVLHFDMSLGKHLDKEGLERYLGNRLAEYETQYGITSHAVDSNDRLTALIRTAYEQTGQKVVVLIDEYDAPLLDVVHEEETLPVLRNVMRNFYSPLKGCDPYLRFVFLTGITKFSQLSIFSELNNIKNISMLPEYAAICGITKEEMLSCMAGHIDAMAEARGMTREETVKALTDMYDGYHFCWPSPDIFNPFSLLNAFADKMLQSYWFGSGTPTYLIEMMRKFDIAPSQLGHFEATAEEFDTPTERLTSMTPLLYQSGYLTIKDYVPEDELYMLDIPNREIRVGLMSSLLPNYIQGTPVSGPTTISKMNRALRNGDIDGMMEQLRDFMLTIPYCENTDYEGHYQQMLYVIFSLLGRFVDVEVRTSKGRVDMVLLSGGRLYLFELKLDRTAGAAMKQIDLKDYPSRFALCGLPVVKVGVNFSREERTITDWKAEEA